MPTVAPEKRVRITYRPAAGNEADGVELPLKILMLGDYTRREDDRPIGDRVPINVNAACFHDVLAAQDLTLDIEVADELSGEEGAMLRVNLDLRSLADFTPEGIANGVPELRLLLERRRALTALQCALADHPEIERRFQEILADEEDRSKLAAEIGNAARG